MTPNKPDQPNHWLNAKSESCRFRKILLPILAISVIPILLISLAYSIFSYSFVRKNYLQSTTESLAVTSASIDENIKGLESLITVLSGDEDILSFIVEPEGQNYTRNARIVKNLNTIVSSYDFISSIYIYSSVKGIIIASNSGLKYVNNFFDTNWIDDFNRHVLGVNRLTTRQVLDQNQKVLQVISLISNLPKGTWSKSSGLIINIDKNKLFKKFTHNTLARQSAFILDENGYVIEHTNKGRISSYIGDSATFWNTASGGSGSFLLNAEHGRKIISYSVAPYTHWIFINEIKLSSLINIARNALLINLGIILSVTTAIILISLKLSRLMYQPVLQLTDSKRKLEQVTPVVNENILFFLIHNRLVHNEEINQAFDLLDINLCDKDFYILLFEIDNYSTLAKVHAQSEIDSAKAELMTMMSNTLNIEGKFLIEPTGPSQFTLLIYLPERQDRDRKIQNLARTLIKQPTTAISLTISCGISSLTSSISHITHAYKEAKTAVQQRLYLGGNEAHFYPNVANQPNQLLFLGPDVEKYLLAAVRSGNSHDIESLAKNMIEDIKHNHPLDIKATVQVFNRIATTLMELQYESFATLHLEQRVPDYYQQIRALDTLDDISDWLIRISKETAALVKDTQVDKININAKRIAFYIDTNLEKK